MPSLAARARSAAPRARVLRARAAPASQPRTPSAKRASNRAKPANPSDDTRHVSQRAGTRTTAVARPSTKTNRHARHASMRRWHQPSRPPRCVGRGATCSCVKRPPSPRAEIHRSAVVADASSSRSAISTRGGPKPPGRARSAPRASDQPRTDAGAAPTAGPPARPPVARSNVGAGARRGSSSSTLPGPHRKRRTQRDDASPRRGTASTRAALRRSRRQRARRPEVASPMPTKTSPAAANARGAGRSSRNTYASAAAQTGCA